MDEQYNNVYNADFYKEQSEMSYLSAKCFVPVIMKYCNYPKSVIDIGCGVGTWLRSFKENGVENIYGIDGNDVVSEFLYVDTSVIRQQNLENLSINKEQKYELAVSLEVAEHLPQSYAGYFIDVLCSYSDMVLFSAAVPLQGGVNHINEQKPSFWYELFKKRGYYCFDILRKDFINREDLPYGCYAQNIFIYTCKPAWLLSLGKSYETSPPAFFYHPWYVETYYNLMKYYEMENRLLKNNKLNHKKIFSIIKDNKKIKVYFNNKKIFSF